MPTASAPQADCERARGNDARRRPPFARWSLSATRDALPNRSRRACPPHAWLGAAAGAISFHDAIAEQLRRSRRHLGRGTWHSLAERRRACGGFAARVAFRLSLACRVRLVRESLARRSHVVPRVGIAPRLRVVGLPLARCRRVATGMSASRPYASVPSFAMLPCGTATSGAGGTAHGDG